MVRLMNAVSVTLPLSVMLAVMVCVPTLRLGLMLAPVPIDPSMSLVHAMLAEIVPSSVSVAVPVIVAGLVVLVPVLGLVIVTFGPVLPPPPSDD